MKPEIERLLESIGERLSHIEALLERFLAKTTWADSVTIPDEEVGFMFTLLSADLVKLPVDILVGDDTPLVIACPKDIDAAAIAAIRHWVVRHKDALGDHWRGRSTSDELLSRIKEG